MLTILLRILLVALVLGSSACRTRGNASQLASDPGVSTSKLQRDQRYYLMQSIKGSSSYDGFIKFSILVGARGELGAISFQNNQFKFHSDFLMTRPEFAGMTRAQIDAVALREQGRKVILGNLFVTRRGGDMEIASYAVPGHVEIVSEDPVKPELVKLVFAEIMAANVDLLSKLAYLPVPAQRAYVAKEREQFGKLGIDIAEQPASKDRICYTSGWTVGRVKLVRDGELSVLIEQGELSEDDILVVDEAPRELPLIAGLVTTRESSPSSHAALLSQMMGSPFVYERDAFAKWQRYADSGEMVFMKANGVPGGACDVDVVSGRDFNASEAARLLGLRKPQPLSIKPYDASVRQIESLNELSGASTQRYGAKAVKLAKLMKVMPDNSTKRGLALPIGLFHAHLSESMTADGTNLGAAVRDHLARIENPATPIAVVRAELEQVRKLIEKAAMPAGVERDVLSRVTEMFPRTSRIRVRSSSNVEDELQFNGAGLYESKGACVGDDGLQSGAPTVCKHDDAKQDPVIKAVKKVWSSLYTLKGFLARRHFEIEEDRAGMGVLIHDTFDGEDANGVAIVTKENRWGEIVYTVTLTGFPGEDAEVTNPEAGLRPETTRIEQRKVEVLVRSSELPQGRSLLTPEQYKQVFELAVKMDDALRPEVEARYRDIVSFDVEWKLADGKISFKQVRPVPITEVGSPLAGKGSLVVGRRDMLLCPAPVENDDAMTKLLTARMFRMSAGLAEYPADGTSMATSPLEAFAYRAENGFSDVAIHASGFELQRTTPWYESGVERRSTLAFWQTLTLPGVTEAALGWALDQRRKPQTPEVLSNPMEILSALEIRLDAKTPFSSGEAYKLGRGIRLQPMLPDATVCDLDAYQGFHPKADVGGWMKDWGLQRKPPVAIVEEYAPASRASGLAVKIEARSALQGFDKTRFMHVERMTIHGLLGRPIVVSKTNAAVYAAAHHNFSFQFAADLLEAEGLTASEKAELKAKGVRYFVFPKDGRIEWEAGTGVVKVEAIGLDEAGKRTELGRMQRTNAGVQPAN